MAKKKITSAKETSLVISEGTLYRELSLLIEKSKQKAISQVKSTVNMLFWQIGKKINDEILDNKRAEYGSQIVLNLAEKLTAQYGRSFQAKNLHRMMQFAELFPDQKIVVTLSRQLSWSHFVVLIPLKTMEARLFYARSAINGVLGVRELRNQIETKTFERTKIANTQISKKSKIPSDTFKAPYMLDFFNLQNAYMDTNAYVLASCRGEEFSYELPLYMHGVFTYSILETFKQAKTAGILSVIDLSGNVQIDVPKRMRGRQNPVGYSLGFYDFIIGE